MGICTSTDTQSVVAQIHNGGEGRAHLETPARVMRLRKIRNAFACAVVPALIAATTNSIAFSPSLSLTSIAAAASSLRHRTTHAGTTSVGAASACPKRGWQACRIRHAFFPLQCLLRCAHSLQSDARVRHNRERRREDIQPGMHPLVGPAAGHTLAHPGAASRTTAARRADLAGRNGFLRKENRVMRLDIDSLKFLAVAEVYPRHDLSSGIMHETAQHRSVAAGRRNAAPLCSIDCFLLCIDPDETAPSLLHRRMNGCSCMDISGL